MRQQICGNFGIDGNTECATCGGCRTGRRSTPTSATKTQWYKAARLVDAAIRVYIFDCRRRMIAGAARRAVSSQFILV